jgi:hypothetical protein
VQTSWKAGESITLKYRVKNISNTPLFVPREWTATCPASPHLWAWFEDSSQKFGSAFQHTLNTEPRMLMDFAVVIAQ